MLSIICVAGLQFSKICFYRLPLLNRTNWHSDIKNIDYHATFRKKAFTFIKPLENDTYGV